MTSIIKVNTIQDAGGNALLTSNGSGTITTNNIGGQNTPAFQAYLGSNQSITSGTITKVTINTETFDTSVNYDHSTNYRFTPTTAGKYYIYLQVESNWNTGFGDEFFTYIYKNGSEHFRTRFTLQSGTDNGFYGTSFTAGIIDMNGSSDYVEGYGKYDGNAPIFTGGENRTIFGAYKIIE